MMLKGKFRDGVPYLNEADKILFLYYVR